MKLQQINRGKGKYYHVYLPKNVVEHALHWHRGDNLEFQVINDNLVLKRLENLPNRYLEESTCPICYNHCVVIKALKNPRRNEFIILYRCPIDHLVIKKFFPESTMDEWRYMVKETVTTCDLCGSDLLEEQFRKQARSPLHPYIKIRFQCRECGRVRVKVIADEILQDPQGSPINTIGPIIQKNRQVIHRPPRNKIPPKNCPVCQEEVLKDSVFCGQCGALLIDGEY
ncbi:MAG: hypothetical protein EU536_02835 [Promethearchaeota archaeon]|nr:MAG: hypothetical protein EU536_02835 [Candidatus Lokiarchaeota archaeon]